MTDSPITPPPELRKLWAQQAQRMDPHDPVAWQEHVATEAARWGADRQFEACGKAIEQAWEMDHVKSVHDLLREFRAACCPKPPSLKEQALKMLRPLSNPVMLGTPEYRLYEPQAEIIRRALEALDD